MLVAGRKQNSSGDEGGGVTDQDASPTLLLPPLPPAIGADGRANPEYYRAQLNRLNQINEHWLVTKGKPVGGMESSRKAIMQAAAMAGLEVNELDDTRSAIQRIEDAIDRIVVGEAESILEEPEAVVRAIMDGCETAIAKCDDFIQSARETVERKAEVDRARRKRENSKRLRGLMAAVLRLRELARHAVPAGTPDRMVPAFEASHLLRFMCYVYRSDLTTKRSLPRDTIPKIADHHCKIAFRYWVARYKVTYLVRGTVEEERDRPDLFGRKQGWMRDATDCKGLIVLCPPRHGKSSIGTAALTLEINKNHRLQSAIAHAQEGKATENMRHVAIAFKGRGHREDNAIGRRNLSLFPASLAKRDNDAMNMRLHADTPTRDPTLRGRGVKSGIGGANLDFLWGDDIVSPEEATQPGAREITATKWINQWMKRLQGESAFMLMTVTLWQDDDTTGRLLKLIAKGELPIAVCILPAGGPRRKERNGTVIEPWQAVWPEMYPSRWLREQAAGMTAYDYSCQFECDPIPDSERVVKKLRMCITAIDEGETSVPDWVYAQVREHQRFMASAQFHYSIDPAATSREQADTQRHKADETGAVYAAVGPVREMAKTESGSVLFGESRQSIRFLDALKFMASPVDAVAAFGEMWRRQKVDKVHVETAGVGKATSELIRNNYKLPSSALIEHKPGRRNKKARLRGVSAMLDDAGADVGLPGATVEFAAVWRNGRPELLENLKWLWDEILNFGFVASDHGADATSQLLEFLSTEVRVGGTVSLAAHEYAATDESVATRTRSRLVQMFEKIGDAGKPTNPYDDDVRAMEDCSAQFL